MLPVLLSYLWVGICLSNLQEKCADPQYSIGDCCLPNMTRQPILPSHTDSAVTCSSWNAVVKFVLTLGTIVTPAEVVHILRNL